MAQIPRRLSPQRSAKDLFGAEVRHWRDHRGLSQARLGELVYVSAPYISKIEKGERWPSASLADACDSVLDTGGVLARIWPFVEQQRLQERPSKADSAADIDRSGDPHDEQGTVVLRVDQHSQIWVTTGGRRFLLGAAATLPAPGNVVATEPEVGDLATLSDAVQSGWPGTLVGSPAPDTGEDGQLVLPGGGALDGAVLGVQVHPASVDRSGRLVMRLADPGRFEHFVHLRHRGLLVGAEQTEGSARFYVMDAGRAHVQVRRSGAPLLPIPRAYELDDLTYAILWASASLDDALLADDATLADTRRCLAPYHRLPTSAVSRQIGADLTSASQMWLGSAFCARHIERNLHTLVEVPAFWTREQRGEEACAWLLFRHKYAYLRRTSQHFTRTPLARAFCVPEDVVATSPRFERILFLLAAALMESLGIAVQVCVEPDYSSVDGFVLVPHRAIIATWVRSEGIWHVDATSRHPVVTELTDAAGHGRAHSILRSNTSTARLAALADYLALDAARLGRRCAELGRVGCANLVRPRSRLLSVTGLDAACRHLGLLGGSGCPG